MSKYPLVSIIIPSFNHGKYIENCINSALNQTYQNIEIVVVNNGSTDNTSEVLLKYSFNNKIKIITLDKNIPPGTSNGAVSIALNNCAGDFISILYSDDWYLPEKIERQINLFINSDSTVGIIYSHGYKYDELTGSMKKWIMGKKKGYVFLDYLKQGDLVIPISPLIKKYCYEMIGTDHPWTGSEYDFFVMSQFVNFDFVDEHLVVMRNHSFNDGKNVLSVYKRVCLYNEKFFANSSTIKRSGKYLSLRLSNIYLIFSRDFAEIGNRDFAKESFYKAFLSRPQSVLTIRGAIIIAYLILPGFLFFKIMKLARTLKSFVNIFQSDIPRKSL